MHLSELLLQMPEHQPQNTLAQAPVPAWMQGAFRRRSITFADGQTDTDTRVFWLQSQGLTIDLRLPTLIEQQNRSLPEADNLPSLNGFADDEGWYAHSFWNGQQLGWQHGCSWQLHNRWPEPAELRRVGNCMMEFAPSGAYVEDWRLLNQQAGPLIALELLSEQDITNPENGGKHSDIQPRQGALIIAGEYAGLVLGRSQIHTEQQTATAFPGQTLAQVLTSAVTDFPRRLQLLDFDTAIGHGSVNSGFKVIHSLYPQRMGTELLDLNGFAIADQPGHLYQRLSHHHRLIERTYRIDTWVTTPVLTARTPASDDARQWLQREANTLRRYTRRVN
jgi:hypothetical protein